MGSLGCGSIHVVYSRRIERRVVVKMSSSALEALEDRGS